MRDGRVGILAIDTATPASSVAIGYSEGSVSYAVVEGGALHAEQLVPAIKKLCADSGCALSDLDAIAVDIGPGLFTGLRVGISTAKSLGQALGIGVVGLVSLDVLVHPIKGQADRVVAAVDARRGEVFAAGCLFAQPGQELLKTVEPVLLTPDQLRALIVSQVEAAERSGEGRVCMVGDGMWRYADILPSEAELAGEQWSHPAASSIVEMAYPLVDAGLAGDPGAVSPIYMRQVDARINWESRVR